MNHEDERPANYRRAIPTSVKLEVLRLQKGKCAITGEQLPAPKHAIFDHVPALWMRPWDPVAGDTIPAQNDSAYIQAITPAANDQKTFGRGGERRISTADGDIGKISKVKRIRESRAEHVEAMQAKAQGESPPTKTRWPSRPFPKGPKRPWPKRSFRA